MAAYNFPNSPSDGDTVTSNGITYTYSSSKTRWDSAAASGSSTTVYATIDLLPLSGASTGDQAFVTGNNRLYIWNGTGWYNIALINTTPSISGVNGSYALATDGTPTTVTITATDPEGLPITYSIASDTSGNIATVSQGTGANTNVFTITPTTNTANSGSFSLTFRASDGVNIATAVSSFTLQLAIENSNYTTALITSVGANNATNSSLTDDSSSNHTITANGNVTQNTFSPYRSGGYSTLLDGNGDTLTVPSTSTVAFGTGAFTVEAWVYILSTGDRGIFQTGGSHFPTTASASSAIQITSSGTKWAMYANNTSYQSTVTYSLNRWYHVALVRDTNSYTTLYVDGTAVVGVSDAANYSGTYLGIGAIYGAASAQCFNGYIRDFRVVKGTAVYTSAFTPPTEPLTAITNTSLLTCHLPYIADGSTNGHAITVAGNVRTEPYGPYDHNGYSAGSNGGSIYFDGSGDYLNCTYTASNFGTGDFTLETWVYNTDQSGYNLILDTRSAAAAVPLVFGIHNTNHAYYYNGTENKASTTVPLNQWTHLALVRSGSTAKIFQNGVEVLSTTDSSDLTGTSTNQITIGRAVQGASHFYGYMSDLRMVKGTAVYTSAFTPSTAPLTAITNTSLLLNGTDAGIIDKSQSVKTITLNGNVKSSTAQTKYLTSSMYFDGTGDYLSIPSTQFGTGPFTIEMWVRLSVVTTASNIPFLSLGTSSSAGTFQFEISSNSNLGFQYDSASVFNTSSALTADTWHHVAISRAGTGTNDTKLFLDGVVAGSSTIASNFNSTAEMFIGRNRGNSTYVTGYISDVRITKGLARYTSAFTPPSAALQG